MTRLPRPQSVLPPAPKRTPVSEAMRIALDFSSADKLLFSSDHPRVQPKEILDPLRSLKLPVATETKILSNNARRLIRL